MTPEEFDLRVREALGPSPTPDDVVALRAVVALLRAASTTFLQVQRTVSPLEALRHRVNSPLDTALDRAESELRVVERSLEPLELGQTVRVAAQIGPNGIELVEAEFRGVDAKNFILLRPPTGVLTEHRMPHRGSPYGLHYEERHRVERWLAARRAANLPTTAPRRTRVKAPAPGATPRRADS